MSRNVHQKLPYMIIIEESLHVFRIVHFYFNRSKSQVNPRHESKNHLRLETIQNYPHKMQHQIAGNGMLSVWA